MNDITRIITNAAMIPIETETAEEFIDHSIDDLYEDEPTKLQEVEKEVLKSAVRDEEEETLPVLRNQTDEDGYYDPYVMRRHKSAEAELQDRFLTIPIKSKNTPYGTLWFTHSEIIEQVSLINITKSEQRGLLRAWADIEILAQGDGNEDIVESDQYEFLLKVSSYKSRSDNPEKGMRERTAHVSRREITDQQVTLPKSEQAKPGFINSLLGRGGKNNG